MYLVFTVFIWLVGDPKLLNNVRHSATKNPKALGTKGMFCISVQIVYCSRHIDKEQLATHFSHKAARLCCCSSVQDVVMAVARANKCLLFPSTSIRLGLLPAFLPFFYPDTINCKTQVLIARNFILRFQKIQFFWQKFAFWHSVSRKN